MSDPPKPTKRSVEAFQTAFAAALPGMLKAMWARWTAYVPDEKAIYINITMLPEVFMASVVSPGGGKLPEAEQNHLDIFKPLDTLSQSGTCGHNWPARVLMRYDADGKVDVDVTWDRRHVGRDLQECQARFTVWKHAVVLKTEKEWRRLMFFLPEHRSYAGDAYIVDADLQALGNDAFTWSEHFKVVLGVCEPEPAVLTDDKAKWFEDELCEVLPDLVHEIFASWSEYVPDATAINMYITLYERNQLRVTVVPGNASAQDYSFSIQPLAKLAAGVRGVHFPARIVLKYDKPADTVDLDLTWRPEDTGCATRAEVSAKMEAWFDAVWAAHSRPGNPARNGDVTLRRKIAELSPYWFEWSEEFRRRLGIWDAPEPTLANVKAFEAELVKMLPPLVRGVWQSWKQHVPDATAISIYLALLPHNLVPFVVAPADGGRRVPPAKAQEYTAHTRELAKLADNVRGYHFPALILLKYSPDRVDIGITWDGEGQGVDFAEVVLKMQEWFKASLESEAKARSLVHSRRGVASGHGDSFQRSAEFKERLAPKPWPNGPWQPSVSTAKAFEAALAAAVPDVVRKIWRAWVADVPATSAVNIFCGFFEGYMQPEVAPGQGGEVPTGEAMKLVRSEIQALSRLSPPSTKRGIDFAARVYIRYRPDVVDIDITWNEDGSDGWGLDPRRQAEWRAAVIKDGEDAAMHVIRKEGDAAVVGAPLDALSAESFKWTDDFKEKLGL
ncbi:uncharacterized protein LOC62_07G008879 [Vanrija pseudolonga]|uniref:Uncharacterized protein n=1 Tax=Vanrija pseudolonga TaxID=143232 RepID=A0AAF1BPE4_9TREE|nr:hypothetical protein LOC62_07G008879 [Vanrija pseudolonga]